MIKKLLYLTAFVFSVSINAQNDADFDTSFSISTGFNDTSSGFSIPVNTVVIKPNGKILVGGTFFTFQGTSQGRIIRLNSDGSKDTTFSVGTGFDSTVHQIKLQSDGKIIVAGNYSFLNSVAKEYIVKLNSDGTVDNTFSVGLGFDGPLFSLAIQNDGKIIVGGFFTNFQGNIQKYLIRLNANGTKDTTFNIGTGFDDSVTQIVIQSDGKILVGGNFSNFNGSSQNKLVRLNADGSKDATFNIGTGFNDITRSIIVQSDSKILVSGRFTTFQGVSQKSLIRLNTDGTKDISFNIGTGFDNFVSSLFLQPNGQILVGGYYSTFDGISQNKLVRLNSNGTKDTTFNIGTGFSGSGLNYSINTLNILSSGAILVGGKFSNYQGLANTRDLVLLKGSPSLSSQTFSKLDFSIYPNPADQVLNILNTLNSKIDFAEVYDLQGKLLIKQAEVNDLIDVSNLQSGMYLMKIASGNKSFNQKFIKK